MTEAMTHVAIVDDDLPVRKALARLLNARSYRTETFESAREFIKSLKFSVPECLIIDVQMPEMTGIELQTYLSRSGLKIPTVIITAHDEPGVREQCYAAGAAAYLLKPLRENGLITAINTAMARASASGAP
jgi:FixJ family two-component response regulator